MSATDRRRCDTTVAIRFPAAVRQAIERAAACDCCSLSEIIRRATLKLLRAAGLLDEETRP
jgi:hypothetical protein